MSGLASNLCINFKKIWKYKNEFQPLYAMYDIVWIDFEQYISLLINLFECLSGLFFREKNHRPICCGRNECGAYFHSGVYSHDVSQQTHLTHDLQNTTW